MHAATSNGFETDTLPRVKVAPPALAPRKRTLRDIGDDLLALDELLADAEGDISNCEDAVTQFFAELNHDEARKIDGYCSLLTEWEGQAEIRRNESKRLADSAKLIESRIKYMKTRLKAHLEITNRKTIETDYHRVTVCRAGGKAPLLIDDPEVERSPRGKVEERFIQTTYSLDKTLIHEALEAGENLDFARLGDRSTYLKIS